MAQAQAKTVRPNPPRPYRPFASAVAAKPLAIPPTGRLGRNIAQAAIQRHPLGIKIAGYEPWERDTKDIDINADIELFKTKINPNNPKVTSIEVRKKDRQDHQVVVVGTEDGKYTQMDLASGGAILRYDVEQDHYSMVVDEYTPTGGLKLHDVFRHFFNVTHAKGFHFENYNCMRFATDLAKGIGTFQGESLF
jgi:hypothetical protein